MNQNKKSKYRSYLRFLVYSLKSLVEFLRSSLNWLTFPERCLTSDFKVANINPVVNNAPRLKITNERIISSTDQEPPRTNLIIWYAKNIPKIINTIIAACSTNSMVLLSILTNIPANKQNYKHNNNKYNNKKQPIKHILFHKFTYPKLNFLNFSKENFFLKKYIYKINPK